MFNRLYYYFPRVLWSVRIESSPEDEKGGAAFTSPKLVSGARFTISTLRSLLLPLRIFPLSSVGLKPENFPDQLMRIDRRTNAGPDRDVDATRPGSLFS